MSFTALLSLSFLKLTRFIANNIVSVDIRTKDGCVIKLNQLGLSVEGDLRQPSVENNGLQQIGSVVPSEISLGERIRKRFEALDSVVVNIRYNFVFQFNFSPRSASFRRNQPVENDSLQQITCV